jgi:hypothetical protein
MDEVDKIIVKYNEDNKKVLVGIVEFWGGLSVQHEFNPQANVENREQDVNSSV